MKKFITFIFATSTLFLVGCATAHRSTAWDYKIIAGDFILHSLYVPPIETQLDKAAADGWQVVAASGDQDHVLIILKRHSSSKK